MSGTTGGRFHWRDGWYFTRTLDGGVRVDHESRGDGFFQEESIYIPPDEWCSIVEAVSARPVPNTYQLVQILHSKIAGFELEVRRVEPT